MKVVVAAIMDKQDRILITRRSLGVPHGGFWEFPGGKLEADELPEAALARELKEELGLQVIKSQFLGEISHQYPDKKVHLLVFLVRQFTGKPSCLEGQLEMKWAHKKELDPKDFPAANSELIKLVSAVK